MAFDVRLTSRQGVALLDLVAQYEQQSPGFVDGHELRVLRNAALRIAANMSAKLPDGKPAAKVRGLILRELVKQLREIDREGDRR